MMDVALQESGNIPPDIQETTQRIFFDPAYLDNIGISETFPEKQANKTIKTAKKTPEMIAWRKAVSDAGVVYGYGHHLDRLADKFRRFGECGEWGKTYRCPDHAHIEHKIVCSCDLRTCPDCSRRRAYRVYKELERVILSMGLEQSRGRYLSFKHIILTSRVSDLLTDLKAVQKRADSVKLWFKRQYKVYGAILGLEIGRNSGMVHIHILAYCPYIVRERLAKIWGLGRIWLKQVNGGPEWRKALKNAVIYGLQFFGKGELPDPELLPVIERGLSGSRRVKTWGIFYNRLKLNEKIRFCCPECGKKLIEVETFRIADLLIDQKHSCSWP